MATKGIFYGIGVGPGDPKLMTLRAVEIVQRCSIIAAPRTKTGGMVALDIVRSVIDLSGKTIVPLDFAMSHDPAERETSHRIATDIVRQHLDAGTDVAMLNLGDVSIYASFHYIWDKLRDAGYEMEMIPGVTSFSAVAAKLGISLTGIASPLHLIPDGRVDEDAVFSLPGTKIWMKSGRHLPQLIDQLRQRNLLERAMMVQNCGMENEKIYTSLSGVGIETAYFTIVIVKETP